ncbi:hypothetical protein EGW08_019224 [Elysia chlorotica]|uniref:Uncharacterized protein n=1 Tax=Elysia chlorotica TaxID=188477 RepID=A0A433SV31_ELYCH|nr:hypothetical protein EGW08_019224 [Elysia chlorotica]
MTNGQHVKTLWMSNNTVKKDESETPTHVLFLRYEILRCNFFCNPINSSERKKAVFHNNIKTTLMRHNNFETQESKRVQLHTDKHTDTHTYARIFLLPMQI